MLRTRPSNTGFTLIEIAIVLGVFAVIMAGIWLVVSVVYENVRGYETNRQLQTIVQNVRQLSQRISGFSSAAGTDVTANYDAQGAFPVEMRLNQQVTNGNLNHPWANTGDAVHMFVRGPTSFGIQITKLPKKACISLVTKLSTGELAGLTAISVNGAADITSFPIALVDAAVACTQATSSNTVEWKFNLRG
jgi:prepilin-type N-terminal cleavage/methylation domain-containing protein